MESKTYHRSLSPTLHLKKYFLALKQYWLPTTGIFLGAMGISVLCIRSQENIYQAESRLLIKPNQAPQLAGLEGKLGEVDSVDSQSNPLLTTAELITSTAILQKTIEKLGLTDKQGQPLTPKAMKAKLVVTQVPNTDILRITYEGDNPEMVTDVVNTVVDFYQGEHVQGEISQVTAVREFLEEKLPEVEANLREAEDNLRIFKESNNLPYLPGQKSNSITNLNFLEQKIIQAQTSLSYADAKLAKLESQLEMDSQRAIAATAVSQSPAIQQAQQKLHQVQGELAQEGSRFTELHPNIKILRREETAIENIFQERVKNTLGDYQLPPNQRQIGEMEAGIVDDFARLEVDSAGVKGRLENLNQKRERYEEQLAKLPALEEQQRELERKIEATQSTYKTLLTKLQEAQIAQHLYQETVSNTKILDAAIVPQQPLPKPTAIMLLAGGLLGLGSGIATALLLARFDTSIKTFEQIKGAFAYTVLGVIPNFDGAKKLLATSPYREVNLPRVIARDIPKSLVGEAYQMLRANLKFLSADKKIKSIVVSSCVAGEGKSEVCVNLAMAMVQVGCRVLIVDGNLRQPIQHQIWELENSMGLGQILAHKIEPGEVIQSVMAGLDVLTAGERILAPSVILNSPSMAELIKELHHSYDAVIIDTPSVTQCPDALAFGKISDGILLVARPGFVNTKIAQDVQELMAVREQNVLGIVANGIKIDNEPSSYFYYQEDPYSRQEHLQLEAKVLNK